MTNNRDYKEFAIGSYYHVYNRGNAKIDIFRDKQDYQLFLNRLSENLSKENTMGTIANTKGERRISLPAGAFDLIAYCLMPNHFHLLLKQNSEIPISKLISKICTSFSKYFNLKYERVGSVFQDQFKSVLVESDEQIRWLIEYIHSNPVKAGIVSKAEDYLYSSKRNVAMVPIATEILADFINATQSLEVCEGSFLTLDE
ncbi:MAG: hypothetical protein COV01_02550 [Candidatus Taylorbacteria bacterium CG10_big_fil_rev_8_21_14_0_10_41_48]|uniref:Transposase IS200-like domain-containing protein n=1 Tax=Candidatus Taylorbacteria bacterium CG10_big_fil_rev_8_21_14_0_10_41_48 TaxID=1975024 RepID=A0A2M8LCM1_9BACT|nr:MAG: hypothetical protein COV01_02550 [Candidatus Taylorbacteria bacterium CG10_big_fil_rev_8_21_14_0_10_41_48]